MSAKVWIDGRFVDKINAKISVLDHGLLFGDGVCVGTRIYGGQVFQLPQHLERLFATAALIGLRIPLTPEDITQVVHDSITLNDRTNGYVRITVTRGAGMMGLDPRKCEPCVIVIADDVLVYPKEVTEFGLHIITSQSVRLYSSDIASQGSTLSTIHAVLAKREALQAGCLDALILDEQGHITGTTDGAFFLVIGNVLKTPSLASCPDPIMHRYVKSFAASAGYNVVEESLTQHELAQGVEAFVASSSAGIVAIISIDQQAIGNGLQGPITQLLREQFAVAVRLGSGEPAA